MQIPFLEPLLKLPHAISILDEEGKTTAAAWAQLRIVSLSPTREAAIRVFQNMLNMVR